PVLCGCSSARQALREFRLRRLHSISEIDQRLKAEHGRKYLIPRLRPHEDEVLQGVLKNEWTVVEIPDAELPQIGSRLPIDGKNGRFLSLQFSTDGVLCSHAVNDTRLNERVHRATVMRVPVA